MAGRGTAAGTGKARDILASRFGHEAFLPGQERVVSALLDEPSSSAIAVFPTGAGKSLTYQLPAVVLHEAGEGTALVVSPLIALMKDQIDALGRKGIAAARLDSSLPASEARQVEEGLRSGKLALLYVAPERFNNERFLSLIDEAKISLFAVDEAHCISEWGHAFRPDYLKLARTARDLGVPRTLALTATATPQVVEDMARGFGVPEENRVVTGFFRPNIKLLTTVVGSAERDALLVRRLRSPKRPPGATIVYVTLQKTAEEVSGRLAAAGFSARAYHAGMAAEERAGVQEWWSKARARVVVATIAFGMGIDRPDVRYVYHYNPPKSLEGYSQEIGRSGRDGEDAVAEAFLCPEDLVVLENFAYGDTPTEEAVRGVVDEVVGDGGASIGPGGERGLNLHALAAEHDVKLAVLKTLLTYLELDGRIRQKTPSYATYGLRLTVPVETVPGRLESYMESRSGRGSLARESSEKAGWLAAVVLSTAKEGRSWYTLDATAAAKAGAMEAGTGEIEAREAGARRAAVVRMLGVLEEAGLAEVQARDVRHNYEVIQPAGSPQQTWLVASELHRRFEKREERELARLQEVLAFAASESCQWRVLCARFGQTLTEPCGACSSCAGVAPDARRVGPSGGPGKESNGHDHRSRIPAGATSVSLDVERQVEELAGEYPRALGHPRQKARFLAGLTSPALTKARLAKHPLFGSRSQTCFQVLCDDLG